MGKSSVQAGVERGERLGHMAPAKRAAYRQLRQEMWDAIDSKDNTFSIVKRSIELGLHKPK